MADLQEQSNSRYQEIEDAKALYFAQDYAAARPKLEALAEEGVTEANFFIGVMYQMGLEYEENFDRAAIHYDIAASAGHADAALNLGILNHAGLLGEDRLYIALSWYEMAKKLGQSSAEEKILEVLEIVDPEKAGLRRVESQRAKPRSLWDRLTGRR